MPHFSRDIGQRLRPTFKEDEDIVIKYIIAEKEREGQDIGPIEARRIALARSATAVTARSARFLESPHNRSKHRNKPRNPRMGPKTKSITKINARVPRLAGTALVKHA